jgi:hypothetical protein
MTEWSPSMRGKRVGGDAVPDHLNKLTNDILQHIIYFLPSWDAVWKCMLSHRYGQQ